MIKTITNIKSAITELYYSKFHKHPEQYRSAFEGENLGKNLSKLSDGTYEDSKTESEWQEFHVQRKADDDAW